MQELIAVASGYVVGSIPFTFLLSRRLGGVDLRRVGSGNVGAANVLRTIGIAPAIAAMCLDAMKGLAAVLLAQRLAAGPGTHVAAGLASVVGHIHPVWLGFHGGKGVATAAGAFALLAPWACAAAAGVFAVAVCTTRYVSVGSVAGSITLAVAAAISDVPAAVGPGAAIAAAVIAFEHRGNLARLAAGTERRLGEPRP